MHGDKQRARVRALATLARVVAGLQRAPTAGNGESVPSSVA
jgi:hypothetical protein